MRKVLLSLILTFGLMTASWADAPVVKPDVPSKGDNMHWVYASEKIKIGVDEDSITVGKETKTALLAILFLDSDSAPDEDTYAIVGRVEFDCKNYTMFPLNRSILNEDLVVISTQSPIPNALKSPPTSNLSKALFKVVCGNQT